MKITLTTSYERANIIRIMITEARLMYITQYFFWNTCLFHNINFTTMYYTEYEKGNDKKSV